MKIEQGIHPCSSFYLTEVSDITHAYVAKSDLTEIKNADLSLRRIFLF